MAVVELSVARVIFVVAGAIALVLTWKDYRRSDPVDSAGPKRKHQAAALKYFGLGTASGGIALLLLQFDSGVTALLVVGLVPVAFACFLRALVAGFLVGWHSFRSGD